MSTAWSRAQPSVLHEAVRKRIMRYLEQRCLAPESVADLWAPAGELLPGLAAELRPRTAVGLCPDTASVISLEQRYPAIRWRPAQDPGPLDGLPTRLDVLLGVLPWHWAPTRRPRTTVDGTRSELTDDPACVAALDAATHLRPGGLAFFVVGPGFLMRPGPGTVFAKLPEFGLHVDGLIGLPRGLLVPDCGAGRVLLVLTNRAPADPIVEQLELTRMTTTLANSA